MAGLTQRIQCVAVISDPEPRFKFCIVGVIDLTTNVPDATGIVNYIEFIQWTVRSDFRIKICVNKEVFVIEFSPPTFDIKPDFLAYISSYSGIPAKFIILPPGVNCGRNVWILVSQKIETVFLQTTVNSGINSQSVRD